jgi:hypothetical protein
LILFTSEFFFVFFAGIEVKFNIGCQTSCLQKVSAANTNHSDLAWKNLHTVVDPRVFTERTVAEARKKTRDATAEDIT